ncbi:MAG: MOSC domain-containing protein [Candidatus Promineifilaceae bacterium]
MKTSSPLRILLDTLPQIGRVEWIGVRPSKNELMIPLAEVNIDQDTGLEGDRFKGRSTSPRQVTLIQQEHLVAIGAYLHQAPIDPARLRRNIVVSGLNLLALKEKTFQIGDAVLEYTGLCHPCSKMERELGAGGYNAMRGHGGITARVLKSGVVRVADNVSYQPSNGAEATNEE